MIINDYGKYEPENIRAMIGDNVDVVSLDFRPESPDYVPSQPIHAGIVPDMANEEVKGSGARVQDSGQKTVGLFFNEMPQTVITHAYNYHLDYILLLGDESQTYIDNLRSTLVPDILPDVKIVKG